MRSGRGRREAFGRGKMCLQARRVVLLFAIAAAALGLSQSVALASQAHKFERAFGATGSAAAQLSLAAGSASVAGSGLAVNAETHDVYVADSANNRIDEFKADGSFVRAWGWGVESGAAELQVCTTSTTCRAGISGHSPGELEDPSFVAVDNDPSSASHGDVYVAGPGVVLESPANVVTKFSAAGALEEGWAVKGQLGGATAEKGPFGELAGLAVDSSGDLWVYAGGTSKGGINVHMFEFAQSDTPLRSWQPQNAIGGGYSPQGIALDGAGDLYISEDAHAVQKLSGEGESLGKVFEGPLTSLAFDPTHENREKEE